MTGAHVQHGQGGPHPDDESVEFEMNAELDRDERRAIDRRAEWYAQQRAARRASQGGEES